MARTVGRRGGGVVVPAAGPRVRAPLGAPHDDENRLPMPSASIRTTISAAHDDAPGLGRTGDAPREDQVHRWDHDDADGLWPEGQPLGRRASLHFGGAARPR